MLRVGLLRLRPAHVEEGRVETVDPVEKPRPVALRRVGSKESLGGQAIRRNRPDRAPALGQIVPEGLDVVRVRETTGQADDRDPALRVRSLVASGGWRTSGGRVGQGGDGRRPRRDCMLCMRVGRGFPVRRARRMPWARGVGVRPRQKGRQTPDRRMIVERARGQLHTEPRLDCMRQLHREDRVEPQVRERGLEVDTPGLDEQGFADELA